MNFDGIVVTASVLLVFAVAAAIAGLVVAGRRDSVVARRLGVTSAGAGPGAAAPEMADLLSRGLFPFAKAAEPLEEEALTRARLDLIRAGIRTPLRQTVFLASKVLLAMVATLGFLGFNASRARPLEPAVLLAILAFAAGYYAPSLWLRSRIQERQLDIERGLPDTLDLLVTCVESGLGLDSALQRVAGETKLAWPALGQELELTFLEAKAGLPRTEAFRRLAHRTGVGELKLLAATLKQTEIFGTSVGLALRGQATGIRIRHMQRAEERAAYASVRMTFPLVACILPALFCVVIGPAIIRIIQVFQLGPAR